MTAQARWDILQRALSGACRPYQAIRKMQCGVRRAMLAVGQMQS
jgi:hypothetical protein